MLSTQDEINTGRQLILLHPGDNVLVVVKSLPAGTKVNIDGEQCEITEALAVGHKLARKDMSVNAKITKYGAPIGSLTCAVKKGQWVHMHNMQSDYLPSHARNKGNRHHGEQER